MANYGVANSTTGGAGVAQNACTTTYQSMLAIAASSGNMTSNPANTGLRRGKIYDILVGTNGTPADNYMEFELVRITAGTSVVWTGTISSVSSAYTLDLADLGFNAFVTMNASAETNLALGAGQPWYVGINQRASYRWVAAPGSEIVYPAVSSATANNGLALKVRSGGYTGTATTNILFQEQ